jgi:hypothetical protein
MYLYVGKSNQIWVNVPTFEKKIYDLYPKPDPLFPKIKPFQPYPRLRPVSPKAIQGCRRFFPRLPKAIQGNFRKKDCLFFAHGNAAVTAQATGTPARMLSFGFEVLGFQLEN